MQRYEHKCVGDKWAIVDHKRRRVIGHLRSQHTAEMVVSELNKMEAAHGA
jgi:hypothetical protein